MEERRRPIQKEVETGFTIRISLRSGPLAGCRKVFAGSIRHRVRALDPRPGRGSSTRGFASAADDEHRVAKGHGASSAHRPATSSECGGESERLSSPVPANRSPNRPPQAAALLARVAGRRQASSPLARRRRGHVHDAVAGAGNGVRCFQRAHADESRVPIGIIYIIHTRIHGFG